MFENQNEKEAREEYFGCMVKEYCDKYHNQKKALLKKATESHMLPVYYDMKRW